MFMSLWYFPMLFYPSKTLEHLFLVCLFICLRMKHPVFPGCWGPVWQDGVSMLADQAAASAASVIAWPSGHALLWFFTPEFFLPLLLLLCKLKILKYLP